MVGWMGAELGGFYIFPNGTICRVVAGNCGRLKVRKIRACIGKYSMTERIGKPYTYQGWVSAKSLNKAERIGTEYLLRLLFREFSLYKNKLDEHVDGEIFKCLEKDKGGSRDERNK